MGIANHPVQPVAEHQNVERVFVGIPDVFTTEQLARFNGLAFLSHDLKFLRDDADVDSVLSEVLDRAEKIAEFILSGSK